MRLLNFSKICLLLFVVALILSPLYAGFGRQQIVSPQVSSDRHVTFSLNAHQAEKVEISVNIAQGNQEMQKDQRGIWSITLGPVEPEIYEYNFIVDKINQELKLLWIGCGKDDSLIQSNENFISQLETSKINHISKITEGAHE